ncbi:GNAT family N-acetyltransferase [Candidatus Bipolaricaulota bacterium]|jgi:RimJ/RimL family protein N-acetyltransferase|nr:GNAT family N-acetyltransferase [Candidatus Bipolaricaulota bacterium]TFH11218.1 MAG: N-acetyltransferase [Candidatus Atribacteria bacterium]
MLVGKAIILRPFRRNDLDGLYDLDADIRERGEFWPLGCLSEPRWLKRFDETSWWTEEFKVFLITDRAGRRLGQVNVYKASHSHEGWELGYRIYRPDDRGKGYTTEAVRLCTAYLFGREPIERIQILLDPRNAGSRAVAENAGYRLEGTLRHAHFDRGEHRDLLQFSIIRKEAPILSDLLAPLDEET